MKQFKSGVFRNERRKDALKRLEATLEKGTKVSKDGLVNVKLTEKDITRIKKEVKNIKERNKRGKFKTKFKTKF